VDGIRVAIDRAGRPDGSADDHRAYPIAIENHRLAGGQNKNPSGAEIAGEFTFGSLSLHLFATARRDEISERSDGVYRWEYRDIGRAPAIVLLKFSVSSQTDHFSAVLASFLGWTLDAFDFFLVAFCLTAIAKDFHKSDTEIALSITVTLAFRPVGAFLFGLLADRYGRRIPLMIDLVFYSVVEVATGFAPSYAVFLVLRALFGIGMGGEWGVGASLAMEKVPARFRGVLSGILQQGYAFGNLIAALCFLFLFPRWGWRPLFFLGGLPALLALFVRTNVKESTVWEEKKQPNWASLGRAIGSQAKLFGYLVLLMTFMNLASHGTQDMYPTFLQRYLHFSSGKRSMISAISMVGAISGGVLVGFLSDKIGRRRAIALGLGAAILMVPLWAYSTNEALLITGAFLIQFFMQGAWGVIPAHLSELSPASVRGFLPGFAYQCGVLLSSSVVVLEPYLAQHTAYSNAMALTAITVFAGGVIVTLAGRERKGRDFHTTD
jgi:SHS family lactate transporter-like MFS transporter